MNKNISKKISVILSVIMLIAAAVPMAVNASEDSSNIWDGTTSEVKPVENVYTVNNGAELAWAFKNVGIAYLNDDVPTIKLANDIYLNDVSKDEWYTGTNLNSWEGNTGNTVKKLTVDGDGHVIYGLYSVNENGAAGLINNESYNVTFKNLGIDKSYIKGKTAAAFVGDEKTTQWFEPSAGASGVQVFTDISFENCFVGNDVIINGTGDNCAAGGFVAKKIGNDAESNGKISFNSCYSLANVSVDQNVYNWNKTIVINCGSFTGHTQVKNTTVQKSYTNQSLRMFGFITPNWDGGTKGVTSPDTNYSPTVLGSNGENYPFTTACEIENMKGFKAAFYMENLGDGYVVTDSYPALKVFSKDGKTLTEAKNELAKAFSGGAGTAEDPYLISDANGLKTAIGYFGLGKNYKLANDIELNDVSAENWKDSAEKWFPSMDGTVYTGLNGITGAFEGTLDGNGYAVKGIYYPLVGVWSAEDAKYTYYTGLIPVIKSGTVKNLTVSDSYLSATCLMSGSVAKAAYIGVVNGAVINKADFENITVDESVTVQYQNAINYMDSTYIGGISAQVNGAPVTLNNCATSFKVIGNSDNVNASRIAGLLGNWAYTCNITISNSLSKGMPTLEWQGGDNGTYKFSNLYSDTDHVHDVSDLKFAKKGQDQTKVESFDTLPTGFGEDDWYAVSGKAPMLRNHGKAIGDVNEDGIHTEEDTAALRANLLGNNVYKNADVNRDGEKNICDLVFISEMK